MRDKGFDRREFLIMTSLGLVGSVASPGPLIESAFAAPKPGSTPPAASPLAAAVRVVDPPPGPAFTDPPAILNLSEKSGVVEVVVDTRLSRVSVHNTEAELMTYNGEFPAPTIRVKKGDRLKLLFKNSLPETDEKNILGHVKNVTNLHTHGWHVSPSGNSDNILLQFKPGDEFQFEYDTSLQEAGTFSYYHPHVHGLVAEQMWAGLGGGALIVEDDTAALAAFETHILIIKDLTLDGSSPEAHTPAPHTNADFYNGKEGELVMVNGQVNPVMPARPGRVQRWRILNASTARYYRLALEGHELYLVGTDGGLLDKPYPLKEILLTPGERIDVLVKPKDEPGTFKFLSLPYDRGANRLERITLMTLSSEGSGVNDPIPGSINPEAARLDMDLTKLKKRKIYFMMANGRGLVNMKDFDIEPYVITSRVGTYEVWEIINISPMDHPFHQHTNECQVLDIKGGDAGYASFYSTSPAWKDTINIPFAGSATVLVPIKDFTGTALFHCHILQHEDIGMMGIWKMV